MIRALAYIAAVAFVAPAFAAEEKTFKAADLVGTWKLTKSKTLPPGATATVVYGKDGSASAFIEFMGKKEELKGTYKVDGDKLIITTKEGDKEKVDTDTILELTADKLLTKNKEGDTDEFTKSKDEKK